MRFVRGNLSSFRVESRSPLGISSAMILDPHMVDHFRDLHGCHRFHHLDGFIRDPFNFASVIK